MKTRFGLFDMHAKFAMSALGMLLAWSLVVAQAHASTTLNFYGITANDASGNAVSDGVASLQVEVIDIGGGEVRFLFTNDSNTSSLTDVYFDDGALLGISSVTSSTGVSFARGAAPPNLPSGNNANPDFETTAGFLADSNSPVIKNGVQNSDFSDEWLAIDFDLKTGKTYSDVLYALTLPDGGDWLRIGLHVQGYCSTPSCNGGTYSESFVNNASILPVPEAQSSAMILAGLGLVALALRRKKSRR